jgi:transcriptional regulator GlxA family with amidase domain
MIEREEPPNAAPLPLDAVEQVSEFIVMPHDFVFSRQRAEPFGQLFDAYRLIQQSAAEPLTLPHLANHAGMSAFHFLRLFRSTFRQTPRQLVIELRVAKAKSLLTETNLPITEICFECGYESLGSFSALFRRMTGLSPKTYRERHRRKFWPVNLTFLHAFAPFCLLDGFRLHLAK